MDITSIILVGFLKDDPLPTSREILIEEGEGFGMGDFFYSGGSGSGTPFSIVGFGDGSYRLGSDGDGSSGNHKKLLNEER